MDDEALYNHLIDALYATFGEHRGFRVTHTKGLVAHGSFFASNEARGLSRAAHFQGRPVPVVLRFTNFSGIPATPDGDPMAGPRGLGVRFKPPGVFTDIVAHSFDGFPVGTPKELLAFLRGTAASVATPPDRRPLAEFLARHPRARNYLETPKPTPASYLAERYYGVNTFRFIDRRGGTLHGRYRIDPTIVEPPLDDRIALARPLAASDDPMIAARDRVYRLAVERRTQP